MTCSPLCCNLDKTLLLSPLLLDCLQKHVQEELFPAARRFVLSPPKLLCDQHSLCGHTIGVKHFPVFI